MKCPFFGSSFLILLLSWIIGICSLIEASRYSKSRTNGRDGENNCNRDEALLVYKVIFTGLWSRKNFPKHFPDWRPKAHFSKLIGRSHNENFKLFRLDEKVTEGARVFAESGSSDALNELSQGDGGIFDEFNTQPIPSVGETESEFFVDGNHSRVSFMARLVPSPDWFVGLDSIDLCSDGNWVSSLTFEGYPLDAGTDNGLTFTSPNWRTEPYSVVTRLTTKTPSHPASSFFYEDKDQLPPMASFQIIKVKEYELSQVFNLPSLQYETVTSNNVFNNGIQAHNLKLATISSYSKKPKLSNEFVTYLSQQSKLRNEFRNRKESRLNGNNTRKRMKRFRGIRNPNPRRRHSRRFFNWTP